MLIKPRYRSLSRSGKEKKESKEKRLNKRERDKKEEEYNVERKKKIFSQVAAVYNRWR